MNCDLISVIMTTYNSSREFLEQAIKSVLNQTYNNFEFIIVDDGSTNDSVEYVLNKFIDYKNYNKIKVIKQSNSGLCGARNTGIINSNGKYIAFIDDDDIWNNNKLEICYEYFKVNNIKDNKIGIVFSQCEIIDEDNNIHGTYGFVVKGNIYRKILGKNIIGPPSSVMLDKKVLQDVGMFNSDYIYAEDIELWYRITEKYNVYSIDIPLIQYRYRKNSMSKNYKKMSEYTEMAILSALDRSKDQYLNRKKILTKYYLDFAYLFFSNNNSNMFKKYYFKCIKVDKKNIINIKLLFGILFSSFGDGLMKKINRLRRREDIPPSYLKVYNFLDNEV